MGSEEFINACKKLVVDYVIRNIQLISKEEVYVVWSVKVLQHNKALLSTTIEDGRYYEITYNGDKEEFYVDAYKKEKNIKHDKTYIN